MSATIKDHVTGDGLVRQIDFIKNHKMISKIKEILWKIKDYDRLERDYISVLDYATHGAMSKPHYHLDDIYRQIDHAKSTMYYKFIADDIKGMDTKEEIIKYINNL